MIIKRDKYLNKLISRRFNGKIKIITGIRRSGKSFLLFNLYKNHLIAEGAAEEQFIEIALDKKSDEKFRNPNILFEYVLNQASDDNKQYYVFIDEIQLSYQVKNTEIDESLVPENERDLLYTTFYDILIDLMSRPNLDIYVTGSNSKMLSKDIATNFRDRGSEIQVHPLSFSEYYPVSGLEKTDAWEEYMTYGGMPLAVLENDENEKKKYLSDLYKRVYLKDIIERYNLQDDTLIDSVVDVLCSSVSSLTNPHNLANAAKTLRGNNVSDHTVKNYLEYLEDAYLFCKARRYDVKGKRYFDTPMKYYSEDVGLRNARLNFRQQDNGHLMENIIFNELKLRGFSVDVGMIALTSYEEGKQKQHQYEIDFVVNTGSQKIYIQSAFNIDTTDKRNQEIRSLRNTGDFFRKIVVLGGSQKPWTDEEGILYIGIIPFLLDDSLI